MGAGPPLAPSVPESRPRRPPPPPACRPTRPADIWAAARSQIASYEHRSSELALALATEKEALQAVQREVKHLNEGRRRRRCSWAWWVLGQRTFCRVVATPLRPLALFWQPNINPHVFQAAPSWLRVQQRRSAAQQRSARRWRRRALLPAARPRTCVRVNVEGLRALVSPHGLSAQSCAPQHCLMPSTHNHRLPTSLPSHAPSPPTLQPC